jgi:ATP-dependent Clp protease ATP-binding subunit ClpA
MLAHESARDLRYDSLDSGCLLLGLIGEETGIAAKALAEQGITVDRVRAQLAAQRPPELKEPWEGHIPFTAEAKSVLNSAFHESRRLGHADVATSHFLLGITELPQSGAARALSALGADFAELRAKALSHHTLTDAAADQPSAPWERFLVCGPSTGVPCATREVGHRGSDRSDQPQFADRGCHDPGGPQSLARAVRWRVP